MFSSSEPELKLASIHNIINYYQSPTMYSMVTSIISIPYAFPVRARARHMENPTDRGAQNVRVRARICLEIFAPHVPTRAFGHGS